MVEIKNIIVFFGLNEKNGFFFVEDSYWKIKIFFFNRVKRFIEYKIKFKVFFCFDNKLLFFFFENLFNKEKFYEVIWNFNEFFIVIIIENNCVEIYNGFNFLKNEKVLEKLGGIDKLNNFFYFELVIGKIWE